MAPIKASIKPQTGVIGATSNILRRSIATRSQNASTLTGMPKPAVLLLKDKKRKAISPTKGNLSKRDRADKLSTTRAAFGDITNATNDDEGSKKATGAKKCVVQTKVLPSVRNVTVSSKYKAKENVQLPTVKVAKVVLNRNYNTTSLKSKTKDVTDKKAVLSIPAKIVKEELNHRRSNGSDRSEDSLYVSAVEEINDDPLKRENTASQFEKLKIQDKVKIDDINEFSIPPLPEGVHDFDKENWDDVYQTSHYAMDIFFYLKQREANFPIVDYLSNQPMINVHMRALLVDWMVEVQESFELNHETLYLAVKLVDTYLSNCKIGKDLLQLVGAAGLFLASKFDERMPPLIDDFLYICDGAYQKRQMRRMEINVLKACHFELSFPLSYRFLRRYARCAKIAMPTLTLARFILEYSLMDYATVTLSDSKLASAALYLALRMENRGGWTTTLDYYSGYKLEDFIDVARILNAYLHNPPKESLSTIRNKYSHKIFFEVAKTPLVQL